MLPRLPSDRITPPASVINRALAGCPMLLACTTGLLALRQHCRLPAARSARSRGVKISSSMAAHAAAAAATAPVCLHAASSAEWSAACAALKEASCADVMLNAYAPAASEQAAWPSSSLKAGQQTHAAGACRLNRLCPGVQMATAQSCTAALSAPSLGPQEPTATAPTAPVAAALMHSATSARCRPACWAGCC